MEGILPLLQHHSAGKGTPVREGDALSIHRKVSHLIIGGTPDIPGKDYAIQRRGPGFDGEQTVTMPVKIDLTAPRAPLPA